MSELTLESLAKRVEALEKALAAKELDQPRNDWRKVVGMFADSDFMRQVDEEGRKIREAERAQARQEAEAEAE
ncbi:MAG TPA: hypothetical protein VMG10_19565 [Gemmataceae bacterium]|nr:hypothetical protein [Gemmataceae bacterium]